MTRKKTPGISERVAGTNENDAAGEGIAPATTAGGGDRDATPSNTASHKDNHQVFYQPLRWGVDSLYLSYKGVLDPVVEKLLKSYKELAQSPFPPEAARAQYLTKDYIFMVKDRGAGLFPFVLDHSALRIQLSSGNALPFAYVKVSSGLLASMAIAQVESHVQGLISHFGEIIGSTKAGRIDLFVDFTTDCDLEGWGRESWVTRASSVNSYSVEGRFSGWAIGLGSPMAARLYDKTLEIKKSKKFYLEDLWRQAGWDGSRDVWRLEIQIKRGVLKQLGLNDCESVISNLNGLWSYAMTQWLKLTIPNPNDQKRSRWPIHPLWAFLATVDWETHGGPLLRKYPDTSAPSDQWLFAAWFRTILSYMAKTGVTDFHSAANALYSAADDFYGRLAVSRNMSFEDYVRQMVSIKNREFCSAFNGKETPEDALLRIETDAYRKASDGE